MATRKYSIELPRLVCLFPLAIFLLALLFDFKSWGLAWTLGTYLFLLNGANLVQTFDSIARNTALTVTANQTFVGLLLWILWLSLYKSRGEKAPPPRGDITRLQTLANRFLSVGVGLWNPAAYTLAAKLFLPFRGKVQKLAAFLDSQLLIACISLYLLALDFNNLDSFLTESIVLPRYFSFATFLFLSITYWSFASVPKTVIWHQPRFWKGLGFVCAMELLSAQIPALRSLTTLSRVGLALTLSELIPPGRFIWRSVWKYFLPPASMLFTAIFVSFVSNNSGVMDLVLVVCEPRAHPTAIALFTFIAGLGLGFLTGSFSGTFFALYSVLMQTHSTPLVKAALIDGILAGSLLSPFSVFNLFPASQFGIQLQDLIRFRCKQLAVPLLIALFIYAVCAINSVAILQPVTFVFLCLVALTIQLRKSDWKIGKPLPDSRSAPS